MDYIKDIEELIKQFKLVVLKILKNINIDANFEVLQDEGIRIVFPEHYKYIDSGRKAGSKQPPIKNIVDFIRKNKIRGENISELQLAFAIAKSISNNGIRKRPFIEALSEELLNITINYIKNIQI